MDLVMKFNEEILNDPDLEKIKCIKGVDEEL